MENNEKMENSCTRDWLLATANLLVGNMSSQIRLTCILISQYFSDCLRIARTNPFTYTLQHTI